MMKEEVTALGDVSDAVSGVISSSVSLGNTIGILPTTYLPPLSLLPFFPPSLLPSFSFLLSRSLLPPFSRFSFGNLPMLSSLVPLLFTLV
jgi:hypothetical protein